MILENHIAIQNARNLALDAVLLGLTHDIEKLKLDVESLQRSRATLHHNSRPYNSVARTIASQLAELSRAPSPN